MTLGGRDAVGIKVIRVIRFALAGYRREVAAQEQAVIAIGLAFVILSGELELLGFINIDRPGAHYIESIGVLKAGLGVINDDFITLTVIPATKTLIRDGHTARGIIISAAHRCRNVFIVIVVAVKPAFAAELQFDFLLRLTFFGHNINQTAGTAAAVQRGCAGNNFNTIDVKRIDRVQLAAVGT